MFSNLLLRNEIFVDKARSVLHKQPRYDIIDSLCFDQICSYLDLENFIGCIASTISCYSYKALLVFEGQGELTEKILSSLVKKASDFQYVYLKYGITSVGKATFSNLSNLISITLPASITSIDDSAFASCSSLPSITIPATCNCSDSFVSGPKVINSYFSQFNILFFFYLSLIVIRVIFTIYLFNSS